MDTFHFEQQYLPKNYAYGNIKLDYKTENDFQVEFNANINNLSEGDKWIAEFERLTKTNWKIRATYPNLKGMQRKDFVCHHSDYRSTEKRKRSNTRIKLSACNAKLTVKIKDVNKYSRCRYPWIKEGMPATVTIFSQHHHAIWNAQALSFRRIDADIHDKFMDYFNQGLSVSSAIEYHINQIDLDPDVENPIIARADAAINPRQRTVSYLYDLWRSANLGSRTGEGMWTTLEEKLPKYTSLGTTVVVDKEKKVIAIVTQLMQRAHTLANSCDIVFIDSSASCDAENHSITFVMLTSKYGAVPGGVIITTGQRKVDYVAGLSALKEALGNSAFAGNLSPRVIMTDDSSAERNALHTIWPSATLLLCHFHVLQAVWRWLWDAKHNVEKENRLHLMRLFQTVLHASSIEAAEKQYLYLRSNASHDGFAAYVEQLWLRKESWCRAWRNIPNMRGHHTNNFCEVTVRIFKDHVLSRCKAYNAVALVDFVVVVMDRFYRNRLEKFANGRISAYHLILEKLLTKADYIEDSSRIVVRNFQGSVIYLVSSETQVGRQYEVDSSVGCCTCDRGMDGSFCKHQVAVYKFFGDSFPNLPPVTAAARHECAVLALGPSALPLAFYSEMNSIDKDDLLSIAECVEVIDPCRSTTPLLPEAKSATVTGVCVSDTQQAWTTLSGRMESLLAQQSGDCSELLAEIQKMEQRLNKVTTYNQLLTFYRSTALGLPRRHHSHATIRTQPGAAARRKQPLITHGAKRQLSGRPATCERRKVKRARNLQGNVMKNMPNAKSHGIGH